MTELNYSDFESDLKERQRRQKEILDILNQINTLHQEVNKKLRIYLEIYGVF